VCIRRPSLPDVQAFPLHRFLSHPTISGFTSGAAVIIVLSQVGVQSRGQLARPLGAACCLPMAEPIQTPAVHRGPLLRPPPWCGAHACRPPPPTHPHCHTKPCLYNHSTCLHYMQSPQLKLILGIKVPRSQAVQDQLRDILKVIHTGRQEPAHQGHALASAGVECIWRVGVGPQGPAKQLTAQAAGGTDRQGRAARPPAEAAG
jgi:hypothetical protein